MPERFETIRATVLHRQLTGENYFRIHSFDAEKGGCRLLFRHSNSRGGIVKKIAMDLCETLVRKKSNR